MSNWYMVVSTYPLPRSRPPSSTIGDMIFGIEILAVLKQYWVLDLYMMDQTQNSENGIQLLTLF